MEGVVILGVLVVMAFLAPRGDIDTNRTSSSTGGYSSNTGNNSLISKTSTYANSVSIGTGNGRYSYQPFDEYITIYNRGRDAINISGWQLKNGKGERTYYLNGSLQRFTADTATIPQGTDFVSPNNTGTLKDIYLGSGETAIITTGQIGSRIPYQINSFRENICSGYLANMSEYQFNPPLYRNCPRPADEPGLEWLDSGCRTFVGRLQSCEIPNFDPIDNLGEKCTNCVNNTPLSSACVAFIKNHFNYGSCIANHQNDPEFYQNTWRIFLGKGWEMWANEYEKISLFDQFGRLVTEISY